MQAISHLKSTINGITLHTVETKKYKTNAIVLKMKAPLKEGDVTQRALLPYVLQSGTENFPSSVRIQSHLEDLYGATLSVDLAKKGNHHIVSFRMEAANGDYLSDDVNLLEKSFALLSEVVLHPNLENDVFQNDVVSKEKRSMKQRLQSMKDDKMRYSSLRLIEEMCDGDPYRLNPYGVETEVDSVTAESLHDYYLRCLKEDEIDLYVVGDVSNEKLKELAASYFPFAERQSAEKETTANEAGGDREPKEVFDEQDVKQGKLNIGFRTNTNFKDDDYFALQVFNGIFGGFSHSKLFINVREKASLAYYAASRLESHKGLLLVMSGVEFANYEKAVSIIKEQMELMKQGEFTDGEIGQTKAVIRNQLLETADSANGLIELLYHEVVAGYERPFEEWLTKIEKVTRDDIVKVAQKIELDTVYFLKGKEGVAQ